MRTIFYNKELATFHMFTPDGMAIIETLEGLVHKVDLNTIRFRLPSYEDVRIDEENTKRLKNI